MCIQYQLCPSLCDPMDGSLPGSSVHRILKARILEGVSISYFTFSRYKLPKMLEYIQEYRMNPGFHT